MFVYILKHYLSLLYVIFIENIPMPIKFYYVSLSLSILFSTLLYITIRFFKSNINMTGIIQFKKSFDIISELKEPKNQKALENP